MRAFVVKLDLISCKSLDLIHRSASDSAIHLTGKHYRRGGLDPVKDAKHRLRRRERSSRP